MLIKAQDPGKKKGKRSLSAALIRLVLTLVGKACACRLVCLKALRMEAQIRLWRLDTKVVSSLFLICGSEERSRAKLRSSQAPLHVRHRSVLAHLQPDKLTVLCVQCSPSISHATDRRPSAAPLRRISVLRGSISQLCPSHPSRSSRAITEALALSGFVQTSAFLPLLDGIIGAKSCLFV